MRRLNIFNILCFCFAFSLLIACGDSESTGDKSGDAGHDAGDTEDASDLPPPKIDVEVAWTEQVGADISNTISSMAIDGRGNIWVAGATEGDLEGSNVGEKDSFIRKYNTDGEVLLTHQFGTSGHDSASSIAVDGSGSVLVGGRVEGDLETQEYQGAHREAYLRKYDVDGNLRWTRQFSTGAPVGNQKGLAEINAIIINRNGQTYAVGTTMRPLEDTDATKGAPFIRKFNSNGDVLWTQHFGEARNFGSVWQLTAGVGLDADGNVWIAWSDFLEEGGSIHKFSPDGAELFSHKLSGGDAHNTVRAASIAVDSEGSAFISGVGKQDSADDIKKRETQALVWKFDSQGNELWMREVGPFSAASTEGVDVDTDGNIWVAGETKSSGGSSSNMMSNPVIFVQKYDTEGELLLNHRVRVSGDNTAPSMALDGAGNLIVTGHTKKGSGTADQGDFEGAFIRKHTF